MKIILLPFLFLSLSLFSQEDKYEGLNEYIISDETTFTIINSKSTQVERKYKALILNRFAEDLNNIALYYNKYTKITSLKVSVYNAHNKLIKKYTLKDCKDIIQDYQSLASDSRIKYLEINYPNYPYTLEVEYKIENKESMFYPFWQPFSAIKQGIEKSVFTVIDKQNAGFRYKGHCVDDPQIEQEGEHIKYTWKVENIKIKEVEPFSGNYQVYYPKIG